MGRYLVFFRSAPIFLSFHVRTVRSSWLTPVSRNSTQGPPWDASLIGFQISWCLIGLIQITHIGARPWWLIWWDPPYWCNGGLRSFLSTWVLPFSLPPTYYFRLVLVLLPPILFLQAGGCCFLYIIPTGIRLSPSSYSSWLGSSWLGSSWLGSSWSGNVNLHNLISKQAGQACLWSSEFYWF